MTGTLEKDDNLNGKDDNSGSPYKEETSLPKNQNGTTTSLQSPELLRISEGSSAIGEGEKDVDGVVFEAIETILRSARGVPRGHLGTAERPLLDGLAKSKILHALENQGYTIHHLLFVVPWESLKRAYNPAGFLIQFATELKSRFQHCKWPNCLLCLDSGVVNCSELRIHGESTCTCSAGEEYKRRLGFEDGDKPIRAGEATCEMIQDDAEGVAPSGIIPGTDSLLKIKGEQEHLELSEREFGNLKAPETEVVGCCAETSDMCPDCMGSGGTINGRVCIFCNGSGLTKEEVRKRNLCSYCFGQANVQLLKKPCPACAR